MPKFAAQIDTMKIPVLGLTPQSGSSAPSAPVSGQLWNDTGTNSMRRWNGSSWEIVGAGSTPGAHTHAIADVTGLQTALNGKAPTSHTHSIANVTGLQAALDGKAPTSHTHTIANVTGLQAALDAKQATISAGTTSQYWRGDKTWQTLNKAAVGLSNVPNVDATNASNITSGTLPTSVLPPLAVNEVFTAANQAAMLALPAQRGDMAIRTDNGRTYVLSTDSPGTLADWKEVTAAGSVVSVNGQTGTVTLTAANVGAAPTTHGHALTDSNITGVLPIAQVPTGTSGTTVALGNHSHSLSSGTITGTLPISKGGTGASTPKAAREALEAGSYLDGLLPTMPAGVWVEVMWNTSLSTVDYPSSVSFYDVSTDEPIILDYRHGTNSNSLEVRSDIAFASDAIRIVVSAR